MDMQRERLSRLFDAVADSYEQVGVAFFGPIAEALVAELDPRPGERALDIGCGRGAALLPIARRVGPSGRAVGGDLSPRMVEQCRSLAAGEGLDNAAVQVMDAQDPARFDPPDELDVIASSLVLFCLPDPRTALERWRPLLRSGGRVGISTFAEQDPAWAELDDVFTPYLPTQLLDARTSGRSGLFSPDEGMEQLFRAAGFVDVRTVHRRVDVRFDDAEHWYRFSMSVGQRAFWAAVPEEHRAEVRAKAFRVFELGAAADGSRSYWQDVRYTLARRP